MVAEPKQPSRKRAPAKSAAAKPHAVTPPPPERDWVDQMMDALANVAENARQANAADPAFKSATRPGGTGSRWPLRLRRGTRTV